jgi:hypothetical protein
MFGDIQKSIDLDNAKTVGAPNFLIALGLSCYTEYWGKLELGSPRTTAKIVMNLFLNA